jgi:hypothetical protein
MIQLTMIVIVFWAYGMGYLPGWIAMIAAVEIVADIIIWIAGNHE